MGQLDAVVCRNAHPKATQSQFYSRNQPEPAKPSPSQPQSNTQDVYVRRPAPCNKNGSSTQQQIAVRVRAIVRNRQFNDAVGDDLGRRALSMFFYRSWSPRTCPPRNRQQYKKSGPKGPLHVFLPLLVASNLSAKLVRNRRFNSAVADGPNMSNEIERGSGQQKL